MVAEVVAVANDTRRLAAEVAELRRLLTVQAEAWEAAAQDLRRLETRLADEAKARQTADEELRRCLAAETDAREGADREITALKERLARMVDMMQGIFA